MTVKSRIQSALALFSILLLSACAAPQLPVSLNAQSLSAKNGRIGVVVSTMPEVGLTYPGADCLLCLAAASVTNSTLGTYAKTLPYDDLPKFAAELAEVIRKKGDTDVVAISEPLKVSELGSASNSGPGIARQDFTPLKKKYGVDKLLVVQVDQLGLLRNYASYVPTSPPRAVFQGFGYLVDLTTNRYDWYLPVTQFKSTDGQWDEPPKFPGLTNAYFQVIEMARDSYRKPFQAQ